MTVASEDQDISADEPEGRQAQKSAAMRARICEGATGCIADDGYHRMSILQVVRRCAISPGALQHHFPTKLDLIAATAEYLLGKSVRWFSKTKAAVSGDRAAFADAVRRSWREQFQSPDYAALLEIMVAARTDPALRNRIVPALEAWRAAIEAELVAVHPATDGRAPIETVVTISRALMTGLLVHDGLLEDEARMDEILGSWIGLVTSR